MFKAQENKKEDGTTKKEFSVTAIFPKNADLSALKIAATQLLAEKYGKDESKWPTGIRSPFRKCKEKWKNENGQQVIPPGYEDGDATFMTFKANEEYRPCVTDESNQDIIEPRMFYSGCYARASVSPFRYGDDPKRTKGNKGISFGLNGIQKVRDGDPLGGRASVRDDFAPVEAASGAASSVFG